MNRRTFILSAGATVGVAAMTAGHGRLFAQKTSVLAGQRQFRVGRISCIFQPESVIFLRDDQPIVTYRTTYRDNDSQNPGSSRTGQLPLIPFSCFTRLSAPTSLLPLSPIKRSAAAAFVCDNINGVNYTAKISQKSVQPRGQILSNGLKWKGMSEIGSDGVLDNRNSVNFGVQGVFDDECKWVNPEGRVQMTDARRFRIVFYDKSRYGIYATIDWHAVDDVKITANQNCLFGVQASVPLAPVRLETARAIGQGYASEKAGFEDTHVQSGTDLVGGGMMMNSNGDYGAQAIYGRRANWVTCWGRLQRANPAAGAADDSELQEGVALMSHPSNPWGISPWNTNSFGYMSPTHIPFLSKPWLLRAGEGVQLRYLILAYTGNPDGGEVDEIYRSYSSS
ncbi:MAG: PmoA family protein [Thermoguttaceae bacterium]|nr:PmoA family protein [Thermoguttaceae bacterium]